MFSFQESYSAVGTAGQTAQNIRYLKDSISRKFQTDPYSALKIDESSGRTELPTSNLRCRQGSISGKFQRDPYSALEIDESSGRTELPTANLKILLYEMKNVFLQRPYFDWMQIIVFVIVISVDPLFFYIPVINNEKKCLDLHNELSDTANVLSSVLIGIHVLIIICVPFASHLVHIRENSHKNQWGFILLDFLIFLPISQARQILLQLF